jgi:putative Ca2+/H+ antiporter (TMEM165/GDT1 family)
MFESFLASLILVGLAEVGDKTQIAVFTLSSKYRERTQILVGVFCAFFIVDGLAVLFGEAILSLIPILYIKIISGAIFLILGILSILSKEEENTKTMKEKAIVSMAFSLIFFSEFGDKTQIATMMLAARFGEPVWVFLGVMCALMGLSIVAVFGGRQLARMIPATLLHRVAGIVFILVGIATWVSCFR